MDHVAIMKPSLDFLRKIVHGEKTIESRWYKVRYSPWNKIRKGETIYFKNAGKLIEIQALVLDVKQYSELNPHIVKELLLKHYQKIGILKKDLCKFFDLFKEKNYCILITIGNVSSVKKPFDIDKSRYGNQASWICIDSIETIKKISL